VQISKGQRLPLSKFLSNNTFQVELSITGIAVDFSAFGLDISGKLANDDYMVFYNQLKTPCNGISLSLGNNSVIFSCDLNKLSSNIETLNFTAAIDGIQTMNQMKMGHLKFLNNGDELACFSFNGSDFSNEKALMLGDLYRKNGEWRFSAVGQGFNGGLSALLKHFGGVEDTSEMLTLSRPQSFSGNSESVEKPKVITLTKKNEYLQVSLQKGMNAPKKILVSATWVDNGDEKDNDDLDLRVGILLPDGRMKIIQAPDKSGSFDSDPYVFHTGDVKVVSKKAPGIETVEINPDISVLFGGKVALVCSVYSAVSNGIVSVASLKPKMRMEYGEQVVECSFEFKKSFGNSFIYTYVIGLIVIDEHHVTLSPSGETSSPCSEATPWLVWDKQNVKLTMNGPPVFKGMPIVLTGKRHYS
jgi:tellurite resistance protein TerA